jgi:hypothetical protein
MAFYVATFADTNAMPLVFAQAAIPLKFEERVTARNA